MHRPESRQQVIVDLGHRLIPKAPGVLHAGYLEPRAEPAQLVT